jgi:hypothetical protein
MFNGLKEGIIMKRGLVVVVALLLVVVCVSAQDGPKAISGGTARTAALGGNPGNPYIMDYSDVFTNPAFAMKYNDLLYGDLGYSFSAYRASGQHVGFTMGLGSVALGISIGHREGYMFAENSYGSSVVPFAASDYMVSGINNYLGFGTGEPLAPIQVYGAFGVSGWTVGAGFFFSSWSRTDQNAGFAGLGEKWEISNNQFGFKLGTTANLTSSIMLDASALFRLNGSKAEFSDTAAGAAIAARSYDASGTEIAVNGRVFIKMGRNFTVVPQARFATFSYEPELSQTPTPAAPYNNKPNSYGRSEFEVGIGLNTQLSVGFVSVGVSLQRISLTNDITSVAGAALQTTENSVAWFDLPKINIGAEFEILSWLTGRMGYFKRYASRTVESTPPAPGAPTEQTISVDQGYVPSLGFAQPDQQLSLGLALLLDRVSIDGYVGERILAAGPYILSGNVQDMFGVLSMSFKF